MTTRNDADFYAPLTHTLALTNGSGAPTLTRSTAMWVFDNEDKLVNVPASAAAFGGARMVRNYIVGDSEDLTDVNWLKLGTSPALITAVSLSYNGELIMASEIDLTPAADCRVAQSSIVSAPLSNNRMVMSGIIKAKTSAGTVHMQGRRGDSTVSTTIIDVTTDWQEFSVIIPASSGSSPSSIWVGNRQSGGTCLNYYVSKIQYEIVDTTASQYVSVGVLSAPYHGAGVDGVKYFPTHKDGTPIPNSDLLGLATNHAAVTNTMLWCRDFTNEVWVATNVTPTKNQTGLDNAASSCSLLTATAANATILQTITAAAAAGCTGWRVTRAVGSGNIYITRDDGANWTDITSLINSDIPTLVGIENTSVLNPVVGFKFSTSGDAIIVDGGINHLGTKLHYLPILTTSAAVTVGAQTLTYPTAGNISDTAGTILATVNQATWSDGGVVGSTTRGLFSRTANKGAQAKDGTNTVNGPSGAPSGEERIGMRWSGSSMQSYSDAEFGAAGSYDGSLNLSTISIASGVTGYVRDVAIWSTSLADADMIEASGTINILGTPATISFNDDQGSVLINGVMSGAVRILGTPATISVSEASGTMLIGNVINGVADQITMTFPDGLMLTGRTIDGVADTITMTAPSGAVLFDDAPRSTVTINGLYAQKTITAKL